MPHIPTLPEDFMQQEQWGCLVVLDQVGWYSITAWCPSHSQTVNGLELTQRWFSIQYIQGRLVHPLEQMEKYRQTDNNKTDKKKKKYVILTGDKFFFSCDFLPKWPLSTGEMHDTLTASQFSASEKGPGTFALEKNPLAQLWRLSTHNHILRPRHPFWHCHRWTEGSEPRDLQKKKGNISLSNWCKWATSL